MTIKQYIYLIVVIVIIALSVWIKILINENNSKQEQLENAVLNYKASTSTNRVYKLQLEQLTDQRDSLALAFSKVEKIKPKTLKELIYLKSVTKISDTIVLKDTFNLSFIDTTITKHWYSNRIIIGKNLIYSQVGVHNEFVGYVSEKKETIEPPSKIFFIRWFQKKHIILECKFKNLNPYDSIRSYKITNVIK